MQMNEWTELLMRDYLQDVSPVAVMVAGDLWGGDWDADPRIVPDDELDGIAHELATQAMLHDIIDKKLAALPRAKLERKWIGRAHASPTVWVPRKRPYGWHVKGLNGWTQKIRIDVTEQLTSGKAYYVGDVTLVRDNFAFTFYFLYVNHWHCEFRHAVTYGGLSYLYHNLTQDVGTALQMGYQFWWA
jgi:hypothetical protein